MSLISWDQTFNDDNTVEGAVPLKDAKVSVFLAGTTTAARVYDHAENAKTVAPQFRTDIAGYVNIQIEEGDYPANQSFDIKCKPSKTFNPTAETIWLKGVQFVKDSGKLKDQIGLFVFDPVTGYLQWETWGRIKKGAANRLQLDDPSNSAVSILDLGGSPSGNTFGYVFVGAQNSAKFYINTNLAAVFTDTAWEPETNNVITLGAAGKKFANIHSCNAVTVAACSPGPALITADPAPEVSVMDELNTIDAWRNEKGEIEYGENGTPEIDYRTLPMRATNKADLYKEILSGTRRKIDLLGKLAAVQTIRPDIADEKQAKDLDSKIILLQKEIASIPYEAKEFFWEDFCRSWDAGEYRTKGAGLRADPYSVDAILTLKKEIDLLRAEITALKEAKPS